MRRVALLGLIAVVATTQRVDARPTARSVGRDQSHVRSVPADGWMITWSDHRGSATRAGRTIPLYALERERGCEVWGYTGRVLSIVGTFVSFEVSQSGNCSGAAHPYGGTYWRTVDLARGGAEVRLDALYPASVLGPMLLADKAVRRMRILAETDDGEPGQLPPDDGRTLPPLSLDELRSLGDLSCFGSMSDLGNASFAFFGQRGDRALVRVGLPSPIGACRYQFTQLGLVLPLPVGYEKVLRDAAREGRLMDRLAPK